MEEFKSAYPLIHNKVISPRFVTPILRRPRLLDWLNARAECRAVVIAAGAGYGKTTLLWQWEQMVDFPCYWYKLDRNDRDWTLHISYLVEAVSQRHPGFGRKAHSILRQMGGPGSSRPGVTAFLLAEMHERLKEPCTFIIDDWQFVASVTEVRGLWNQILRDAPPTCRFVFSSRGKPQLQFARFKTHGGYAELRTNELRMTEPEITELFRDVYRDPLTPDEAVQLERRTEGWAASLQLVGVTLRERKTPEKRRALIESITARSDTDLFSFLAEEVMEQQTEETRNFLLSTSILQQITPDLAERLAGVHDGTRRLLQLEHAGLFTYRLDEARYRYHGLFRDFLERRLSDERTDAEITGLHIHAASYYETSTEWPEAIYHYLRAGLQRQAARLIARYGEDVVAEGRLGMVDEWLQQLPDKAIRDNARLSLLHGEALGIRGEFASALAALERARTFFAKKGDRRMQALALVKESAIFHHWGRPETAYRTASEGLSLTPRDDRALLLRLKGNIAITSLWLHAQLGEVLIAVMQVTAEATQMGLEHYAAIGLHNVGHLQLEMGQISKAVTSLERAAEFWTQPPSNPFADNYNLVRALLAQGNRQRALEVASIADSRTRNWQRANTEAKCGLALAVAAHERWEDALDSLRVVAFSTKHDGNAVEAARIHFLEIALQAGLSGPQLDVVARLLRSGDNDPRLEAPRTTVLEVLEHTMGRCGAECGTRSLAAAASWGNRGARLVAATTPVLVARLLLDHRQPAAASTIAAAIKQCAALGILGSLAAWLRPCKPHIRELCKAGGLSLLAELIDADPTYWIPETANLSLARSSADERGAVIEAIERHAVRETAEALSSIRQGDFVELRARLLLRHAPTLFIRTLGKLEIRRTSWEDSPITLRRRRTRALMSLLATQGTTPCSRDSVLDALWPDADPSAAVNSLNQTLFQLRREIDPNYHDGQSPPYVISSADQLQLHPDLVRIDWVEVVDRAEELGRGAIEQRGFATFVTRVCEGEFLAESRYDDWSAAPRQRVHELIRDALLLPMQGRRLPPRERAQIARALLALDPWDEPATIALAQAFSDSGRRPAAIALLRRYARRVSAEFEEPPSPDLQAASKALGMSQLLLDSEGGH